MRAILADLARYGSDKAGTVRLLLESGADIFIQPTRGEFWKGALFLDWFWSKSSTWTEFHRDVTLDLHLRNFVNPHSPISSFVYKVDIMHLLMGWSLKYSIIHANPF